MKPRPWRDIIQQIETVGKVVPHDYRFDKSPNGFRTHYEAICERIVAVDCPGSTSANLRSLPYENVTRPIYPLDEDAETRIEAQIIHPGRS